MWADVREGERRGKERRKEAFEPFEAFIHIRGNGEERENGRTELRNN